jgi:hypothetical protein
LTFKVSEHFLVPKDFLLPIANHQLVNSHQDLVKGALP